MEILILVELANNGIFIAAINDRLLLVLLVQEGGCGKGSTKGDDAVSIVEAFFTGGLVLGGETNCGLSKVLILHLGGLNDALSGLVDNELSLVHLLTGDSINLRPDCLEFVRDFAGNLLVGFVVLGAHLSDHGVDDT